MIDPSFWIDEKLGTVEPVIRLLFMGLISQADDEGRLNGHPALVRSLIFPYDHHITPDDLDEWLNILARLNLILRYEVDQQKYILVVNFKKHQTINRPQPSKLPAPPNELSVNDSVSDQTTEMNDHGSFTEHSVNTHGIITDDSLLKEKNLKEKNLKEYKRSEYALEPFNDSNQNQLFQFAQKCEIQNMNIMNLEDLYEFIPKMEIGLIEEALKRSFGKSLNYALKILKDWESEGKTKLDDLRPARKGNPVVTSQRPKLEIIKDKPANPLSADRLEEIRRIARELDGGGKAVNES
jgi:hypothetical protein